MDSRAKALKNESMDKPQTIVIGNVRLEVKDGQLRIWPNKPLPGSPVVVDAAKLERWARTIYRQEVLR